MSTITTIQGSDVISTSRTDINTNFANLNTDKIETSYLDTDTSLTSNSDTKIATQKAVKAYVLANVNPTGASWNEYAADAGSTDAYAITLTGLSAYDTGQTFKFKANTANTSACTLNVNGLGAKDIKKDVSTALVTGDILANQIVTVIYDGTNMQLVSQESGVKDATKLTGIVPITNLPTPVFQQDLENNNDSIINGETAVGSNQTGSVLYTRVQGGGLLNRFERDLLTGQYWKTHSITPTLVIPSSDVGSIIVIGNYMYIFTNDATNIVCSRFLAADLTGEQVMTVPTVASASKVVAWTDGTNAYVVGSDSPTTSRKWSVSGTTFSAVSTATVADIMDSGGVSSMWDGSYAYIVKDNTTNFIIYKLTSIDGSVKTTTTKFTLTELSDVTSGAIILNIDTTRIYIGNFYAFYDEAAQVSARIRLSPITKP